MSTKALITAAFLPWLCATATCPAQPASAYRHEGDAKWIWIASTDRANWHSGQIVVEDPRAAVTIRAICSFSQSNQVQYFGFAYLDAFIAGTLRNDRITYLSGGQVLLAPTTTVHQLPGMLKIDDRDDTAPPGEGPRHARTGQSPPQSPGRRDNPIIVWDMDLTLGGEIGDRLVDAAWYQDARVGHTSGAHIQLYEAFTAQYVISPPRVDYRPLTIRVVPAPAATLVLLAAVLPLAQRRRG